MFRISATRSASFLKHSFAGGPRSHLISDAQSMIIQCLATSGKSGNSDEASIASHRSAYVHPLSQLVLEHLQNSCSVWVSNVGLDKGGLTLNKDGTFILRFPSGSGESGSEGKIWTAYEPTEKKHWLVVQRGNLVGQYMLQDNLKPAWHSSKLSTPEKVQAAVDEMISKLENQEK